MKYDRIEELKNAFKEGKNVITRAREKIDRDNPAIEIAYDLQTGSYRKFKEEHPQQVNDFVFEMTALLLASKFDFKFDSVLDCGCGECTTTEDIMFNVDAKEAIALEGSLSRLIEASSSSNNEALNLVCASMTELPLATNSVNLAYTVHAIEPNAGLEWFILSELHRVSCDGIVLFEPCFENMNSDQQARARSFCHTESILKTCQEFERRGTRGNLAGGKTQAPD